TIENKINNYLQTLLQSIQYTSFTPILYSAISNEASSSESVPFISLFSTIESEKPHYNATAQKSSINKQRRAEDQLAQINETKQEIKAKKIRQKLKNYAATQARSQAKKHEALKNRRELVKNTKQFASAFASHSVIISQNDKAKILLGIPAVGRTFKTIQSVYKPVEIP
ncbi:1303_t:CDS:2, partial [Gigaspora margarita]